MLLKTDNYQVGKSLEEIQENVDTCTSMCALNGVWVCAFIRLVVIFSLF